MPFQICLTLGIILLSLSCFLLYKNIVFLKTSERAKGEVIELEVVRNSSSKGVKTSYKPVFEFITKEGKTIMHTASTSSNPPIWKVGEKAIYAFKLESPEKGKVVTYFGVFNYVVILACVAFPLLIIGGGYYISEWYLQLQTR